MMLLDHLKAVGKSIPAFASELGESENTIRKIVYGQRQPSLPLAVKIVAATDGVVTAADLVISAPAVCGACDVRADNPSVRACTRVDCPLAQKEAA